MSGIFFGDDSLRMPSNIDSQGKFYLILPNGVTSIRSAASPAHIDCLKSIKIPDTLESIQDTSFGLAGIENLYIPDSVTSIGNSAFIYCTELKYVRLPKYLTSLPASVFDGCTSLESVSLPLNLEEIGYHTVERGQGKTFNECSSLTKMVFPKTLTTIYGSCFTGCTSLSEIFFTGDPPTISDTAFSGLTLTIYYDSANTKWTTAIRTSTYGGAASVTWKALSSL